MELTATQKLLLATSELDPETNSTMVKVTVVRDAIRGTAAVRRNTIVWPRSSFDNCVSCPIMYRLRSFVARQLESDTMRTVCVYDYHLIHSRNINGDEWAFFDFIDNRYIL